MSVRGWVSPAIRVAGAGLGSAFAGPLGGAIGGYVGGAFGDTVREFTKKFGEESGKKLFEAGQDSLLESLKSDPLSLEGLYRESLRLSLAQSGAKGGLRDTYPDWFAHWNTALASADALELMPVTADQTAAAQLDDLLRRALVRLDAQGAAMEEHKLALTLAGRALPDALFTALEGANFPEILDTTFRALLVKPAYEQAWRQATQRASRTMSATLARMEAVLRNVDRKIEVLPQVSEDTAATYKLVQQLVQDAARQGQISDDRKAKDAEIARLSGLVSVLQAQLAARSSEPTEQKLSNLIAEGNVGEAVALKSQQVADRRDEAAKLPRDLFELGTLHELNFDWSGAFESYKEAWQLDREPEYGFRYAFAAQHLNRAAEAIDAYEAVLAMLRDDPAHRAMILNNLASLLRLTPRIRDTEDAFLAALTIYRGIDGAQGNVAATLNNLGVFYQETNRPEQAEVSYNEALSFSIPDSPFAPPPTDAARALHADILNNLGNFLNDTEQPQQARDKYLAAIEIYRLLMKTSPGDTAWRLAAALSNLALTYAGPNSLKLAEAAYLEAFRIYQDLVRTQREAYLPRLGAVLYSVGQMYLEAGRASQAITPYLQALSYRRELVRTDPQTYQPEVAATLNSLGNAYRALPDATGGNAKKSEDAFTEAILIRRGLATGDPDKYQPKLASSLMNFASLLAERGRFDEARDNCDEAETTLTPHWQADSKTHGNLLAKTLWTRSLIGAQLQEPLANLCGYAQRSLAAGGEPSLRKDVERFLSQYCSPASFA